MKTVLLSGAVAFGLTALAFTSQAQAFSLWPSEAKIDDCRVGTDYVRCGQGQNHSVAAYKYDYTYVAPPPPPPPPVCDHDGYGPKKASFKVFFGRNGHTGETAQGRVGMDGGRSGQGNPGNSHTGGKG